MRLTSSCAARRDAGGNARKCGARCKRCQREGTGGARAQTSSTRTAQQLALQVALLVLDIFLLDVDKLETPLQRLHLAVEVLHHGGLLGVDVHRLGLQGGTQSTRGRTGNARLRVSIGAARARGETRRASIHRFPVFLAPPGTSANEARTRAQPSISAQRGLPSAQPGRTATAEDIVRQRSVPDSFAPDFKRLTKKFTSGHRPPCAAPCAPGARQGASC